jgi:Xaa-Pro aminopeptidase
MNDTISAPAGAAEHATRLARLRKELAEAGLAGFIIPHTDEHQSEYLPPAAERLAWLTGFKGSAGTAIVLGDEAAIFVDGRYTLQVRAETDAALFAPEHLTDNPPLKWLAAHLKAGDRIGYDPWLMTVAEVRRFSEVCKAAEAEFVPVADNPLDRLWSDRPPPPLGAVALHPIELSGEATADKIARLQQAVAERRADAAVMGLTDSIAWTFNIRGGDILHSPVSLAFALLPKEGKPTLFIDGRKLSNAVRDALSEFADIREPATLGTSLAALGKAGAKVMLDPATTADAIASAILAAGGTLVEAADPAVLPKARKNATELDGARRAHIRDGAAMVRFLAWIDREGPTGTVDEIAAADRLRAFRAETAVADGSELVDISFDTISGVGPNGAIVHYRVSPKTTRAIAPDTLYLIDSGAQYRDGTTDITRTIAIGTPTPEMRDRFTRVLKGHLAVAMARFPAGTSGAQIDTLARQFLWAAGLDFDHGTGHGIGSFLNVHEGPARISKLGTVPLEAGMILSDEPGYYKTGAYGIRIENLIVVTPAQEIAGGDRPMLGFETITLAPIDRRLIEPELMSGQEIAWLDAYHASLPARLGHLLDDDQRAWLAAATRPLA